MKKNFDLWPIFLGFFILIFIPKIFPVFLFLFLIFSFFKFFALHHFDQFSKKNNFDDSFSNFFKKIFDREKIVEIKDSHHRKNFSFSPKMPKLSIKFIVFLFLGLASFLVVLDGFVNIPAGSVAVIFDRGRGVLQDTLPEGLHLKIPFWQKTTILSTRMQTFTMSENLSIGDLKNNYLARGKIVSNEQISQNSEGNAVYSLTKDGQKVTVDLSVQFHLTAKDASEIYQKIGENYLDKIVRPSIRSSVRETITGFESKELFTFETRQKAELKIEESLRKIFNKNKLELDDVLVRNVGFSDVYLRAIEEKQIAEQRIQKAEFERQEAEKIKERKIIEAQAEAEAIRLKGETLRANPSVIQFEFVQKMAPQISWGILPDGALPLIDLKDLQNNN